MSSRDCYTVKHTRVFLFVLFTACLIIALSTFLLGCNSDMGDSTCINSFRVHGTTIDHCVHKHTCSRCVAYGTSCTSLLSSRRLHKSSTSGGHCHSVCTRSTYYECYDISIVESYVHSNHLHHCTIHVGQNYDLFEMAVNFMNSHYPLNHTVPMYVNKLTDRCELETKGKILTIIGILFFSLAGCILCAFISMNRSSRSVIPQHSVSTEKREDTFPL